MRITMVQYEDKWPTLVPYRQNITIDLINGIVTETEINDLTKTSMSKRFKFLTKHLNTFGVPTDTDSIVAFYSKPSSELVERGYRDGWSEDVTVFTDNGIFFTDTLSLAYENNPLEKIKEFAYSIIKKHKK